MTDSNAITKGLTDDAKALAFCSFNFGVKSKIEYGGLGAKYAPSPRAQAAFDNLIEHGFLTCAIASVGGRKTLSALPPMCELVRAIPYEWALLHGKTIVLMEPSQ